MSDEITTPEPQDLSALDDAALHAAYSAARTRGQELAAKEAASFSAEEVGEFDTLATQVGEYAAEITARKEKADAFAAKRDSFSSLPELAAPVAAVEPVKAPVAPVQAAPVSPVPSVSELASQAPVVPTTVRKAGEFGSIVTAHVSPSAAGLVDKQSGEEYSGTLEISRAFIKNAQQFGRQGGAGTRQPIVQFKRNRGAEFTIDNDRDGDQTMRVLRHARDENRLHGGSLAKQWQHNIDQGVSLTAAAGWCAPSQNDYDLCRNWSAGVGLLDLPTVTVTRGGINYTDDPTFPEIYANAVAVGGGSNFLTEAQVIADTIKTCSEIPCPTFEDRRLDVMALCIRVSFLQAAGYPEVVNAWQDGLLAAHEQEMNRIILANILARAGAATVLTDVDPTALTQDSFTSALLAGVELAREDLMYRFMLSWSSTIEVILPHWVLAQIRADLSRRNGVNLLSVTDSEIASLFSVRGVRVQFVRGWQDGLITGGALDPAFPGGDAATPFMTALPSTVNFLAYPAGSIAVARQDVVTLTNVYDAASLATNEFTSLFAEEGFAPIYPCPGQRLYTVAGCVAGVTGAANIDCAT
jgi:hypothetical protein